MLQSSKNLRSLYGRVFITSFEDGIIVPWKPIPLGEYIQYDLDFKRGVTTLIYLEDEIFKRYVTDSSFVQQIDYLKAGVVSTVAQNIWNFSGPVGIEQFNEDLNIARAIINTPSVAVLHQLVQLILNAFPYKPEDVYAMDYETFMIRVAQAEQKLLALNVIQSPIELHSKQEIEQDLNEQQQRQKKKQEEIDALLGIKESQPKKDLKNAWESQQKTRESHVKEKPNQDIKELPKDKWWKVSPVLENAAKHHINFDVEKASADDLSLDNHEKAEAPEVREWLVKQKLGESRQQVASDAQWIYKDLIAQLEQRKQKTSK